MPLPEEAIMHQDLPPRQILGYGAMIGEGDYTQEVLDKLARQYTPGVYRLQKLAEGRLRARRLLPQALVMRRLADTLNERIDQDAYGGKAPCPDPLRLRELPEVYQKRVNLENQARLALVALTQGRMAAAQRHIRSGIAEARGKALTDEARMC